MVSCNFVSVEFSKIFFQNHISYFRNFNLSKISHYTVLVALADVLIGYSVIVALTGLPIGYSVIVALTGLPIGYSVIVALTGLPIGYSVTYNSGYTCS